MSSGKKLTHFYVYQAPLVINNSKMAVTDLEYLYFLGEKGHFFLVLFLKIPHSTDIYPEISKVDDKKKIYIIFSNDQNFPLILI